MRDKIRKENPENHIVGFFKNAEVERVQKYSTQVKVPLHYWNFT